MAEKKKKPKPRLRDVTVPGQAGARMITSVAGSLAAAMKKKKKKK